jgi:DNA-binding response OmpR family regulator
MNNREQFSVLVVDDDEAARYSIARGLRASGYRTVEASAGAEALELAEYVSAVVLDIHLPDLVGFEVCRLIRSNDATSTLPVVHVSAKYVSQEDRVTGMAAGADDYLVAPVDPAQLASVIDGLLARPR